MDSFIFLENMQKSIILFTWENDYALHQEVLRWYTSFLWKHPDGVFYYYNPANWNQEEIEQCIYGWGLFSTSKLIMLSGIPLDATSSNTLKANEIEILADDILTRWVPDDVILVLISHKPDKRTKFFKAFPPENIKEFKLLSDNELKKFIKEKSDSLWLSLWENERELFLSLVGKDQFRLTSELEKLVFYQQQHPDLSRNESLLKDILHTTPEVNNFEFFDYLLQDPKKAYQYLLHMQESGDHWTKHLWMLYRWIKNYLLLIDAYSKGIRDSKMLASWLKMHPFVLSKNLKNIHTLLENKSQILTFYRGLITLEVEMKSWLSEQFFSLKLKELLFNSFH